MSGGNKNDWGDTDDIMKDMWTLTEFSPSPAEEAKKSKARMKYKYRSSLTKEDEPVEYCPSGRGHRPYQDYVARPGVVGSDTKHENVLIEQIREVSGLGFSNEMIMHTLGYKSSSSFRDEEKPDANASADRPEPLWKILKSKKLPDTSSKTN